MNTFKFSIIGLGIFILVKMIVDYNLQLVLAGQGAVSPSIAMVLNKSISGLSLFIFMLLLYGVIELLRGKSIKSESSVSDSEKGPTK